MAGPGPDEAGPDDSVAAANDGVGGAAGWMDPSDPPAGTDAEPAGTGDLWQCSHWLEMSSTLAWLRQRQRDAVLRALKVFTNTPSRGWRRMGELAGALSG